MDTDTTAGARISGRRRSLAVREIDEELAEVRTSKELALDEGDFALAARLRDLERRLRIQRAHLEPESKS